MNIPTRRQAQFLAFIHDYTKLNGRPPAEADIQRYFGITPPSVHQMVVTLEKRGLIEREPGQPRSIRLLFLPEQLLQNEPAKPIGSFKPKSILGHWRITQMDSWDQDFVDAEVEGMFVSIKVDRASFSLAMFMAGLITSLLSGRASPSAEWSWEGK